MLVLKINPIVGFVANYLCLVLLDYFGNQSLHSKALIGWPLGLFYFIYLLILAALGLSCGTQDLRCGAQASLQLWCVCFFSLQLWCTGSRACRLCSCGMRALQLRHAGLVALRYVGSQFPNQGSNPCPSALEGGFFTTGPPGKSQDIYFTLFYFIYLFLAVLGLRYCTRAFSSCGARASHCSGFSCCRAWALGVWAQQLWLTGLVAPRHVGSSRTRD